MGECQLSLALPPGSGAATTLGLRLKWPLAPPSAQDRPTPSHQGGGSSWSPLVQFETEVYRILETRQLPAYEILVALQSVACSKLGTKPFSSDT